MLLAILLWAGVGSQGYTQHFLELRVRFLPPEALSTPCEAAAFWRQEVNNFKQEAPDSALGILQAQLAVLKDASQCPRLPALIHLSRASIFLQINYQPDSALQQTQLAQQAIGHSGNYPRVQSKIYGMLGNTYQFLGQLPKAEHYGRLYLEYARAKNDSVLLASALNNLAIITEQQEKFSTALALYREALRINTIRKNKLWISYNNINLGLVYQAMKDYSTSTQYLEHAISLSNNLGDYRRALITSVDLASNYIKQEEFAKARRLLTIALDSARAWQDPYLLPSSLNANGELALQTENYPEALDYFKAALKRVKQLGYKEWEENILYNLGKVSQLMDRPLLAMDYLQASKDLALTNESYQYIDSTFYKLAEVQAGANRPREALATLKAYQELSPTLHQRRNQREITAIEAHYELLNHRTQRTVVASAIQKEQQSVFNLQLWLTGGLLGLLVLSLFTLRKRFNRKRWYTAIYFLTGLTLVEFIFVLLDPYINDLTSGMPALVLLVNFSIVLGLLTFYQRIRPRLEGENG